MLLPKIEFLRKQITCCREFYGIKLFKRNLANLLRGFLYYEEANLPLAQNESNEIPALPFTKVTVKFNTFRNKRITQGHLKNIKGGTKTKKY